jgi:outer membrane protein TolC
VQGARSLDAQIASASRARESAQAAWQLATARYKAGLGTQLDVLTAQRPLLQIEQQIAALRAQRLGTSIDLDRALGGGLRIRCDRQSVAAQNTNDITKAPKP